MQFASSAAKAELLIGLTDGNQLVRFESTAPQTILGNAQITGVQTGESILGIDLRPATGQLYGYGSTSRLYTINVLTGVATEVGSGPFMPPGDGVTHGFDFNPAVARIRLVRNANRNLQLHQDTGQVVAVDGPLAYVMGDTNFGVDPTVTGSAYINNFPGTMTTTLFGIDSGLNILVRQDPPNAGGLVTIGSLGLPFSVDGRNGFDVSGLTGIAYAAFINPLVAESSLFTINLATGAATQIGSTPIGGINSGIILRGLTAAVIPEPSSFALLGIGGQPALLCPSPPSRLSCSGSHTPAG
ncbi:DUF4394 domain-containing protein [soil metagenome]